MLLLTQKSVTENPLSVVRVFWSPMYWNKLPMVWPESIIEEWRGSISYEAISEAVRLSRQAFLENADKYALGPIAA